jgi:predicted AAA+ superfamily ATPase
MVFLMGPRQVGKTTVSLESAAEWPKHSYFNWDNPTDRLLFIEGPYAIARKSGLDELMEKQPVLIFDEIRECSLA